MFIIHEDEIDKGTKISRWLIGPWNTTIKNVEFGIADLKKGDIVKPHYHKKVQEFLYIIDGEIEVQINKEKKRIGKGTVVYFEIEEVHSFTVISEFSDICNTVFSSEYSIRASIPLKVLILSFNLIPIPGLPSSSSPFLIMMTPSEASISFAFMWSAVCVLRYML